MLNYENHMEVRLVKDKEPPPPPNDAGKTIVTVTTISISTYLTLKVLLPEITIDPAIAFPQTIPPTPVETFDPEWSDDLPMPPVGGQSSGSVVAAQGWFQIVECNTIYPAAANFRAYPGLASHGIRGVVPHNQWVMLTGAVRYADGIVWHQVVNQSRLWRSFKPGSSNQLEANQLGWVAGCFMNYPG
ncbi:MAG: hypothetical protein Fur0046_35950 [Cyanobacteria bacterium J069]|nr:MAG: hypothetical protein D6742_05690 [Cyanobacteria bacterium J069]